MPTQGKIINKSVITAVIWIPRFVSVRCWYSGTFSGSSLFLWLYYTQKASILLLLCCETNGFFSGIFRGDVPFFFVFLLFHFDRGEMDGFRQGFDEIIYEYAGFILERNDKISVICVTVFFLNIKKAPGGCRRLWLDIRIFLFLQINSRGSLDGIRFRINAQLSVQVAAHGTQDTIWGTVNGIETACVNGFHILCQLSRLSLVVDGFLTDCIVFMYGVVTWESVDRFWFQ